MNIFLFNKALRCYDNTTLINQLINEKSIIPIFIFTEQVNDKKNKYFSNNSVQFMVESLHDLSDNIKKYDGKLYFFHTENFIDVFKNINKNDKINSIGTNFDYSPYALNRQNILTEFCNKHNIKLYIKEDHVLYPILEKNNLKNNGEPYTVFTPFKNNCLKKLTIIKPNNFNKFKFIKNKNLENNKFYIPKSKIDMFYNDNPNINVHGGRINGLYILKNSNKFINYGECRDYLTYKTTQLGAYNHFGCVSIREVYEAFKNNDALINELIWRDYYYMLYYYFPQMLYGQLNSVNQPFKLKFSYIKWNNDEYLFKLWTEGNLGIPIVDAGMRQLNITGFLHNRLRMVCGSIITKLLLIDWKWAEQYFAQKLTDYDCIQNSGGWAWIAHGIDPNQVLRIFNPFTQSKKFDSNTIFIKYYIPELSNVSPKDIHNWDKSYIKYSNINYPKPAFNYIEMRQKALAEYSRVNKL